MTAKAQTEARCATAAIGTGVESPRREEVKEKELPREMADEKVV